uniref:Chorion early B n=1 Tax=Bombyx mori TaxID=7091 RepID=A0A0K2S3H1_BOMMO|nr:chorion early B [Bombyx mori]
MRTGQRSRTSTLLSPLVLLTEEVSPSSPPTVGVCGSLPFLGTADYAGEFPTYGAGGINYGCDDGGVGMASPMREASATLVVSATVLDIVSVMEATPETDADVDVVESTDSMN